MLGGNYLRKKMNKRKEVEDVSDDFSDFSLSSPARKIRRLDAELPPIMEEEEERGEKEREAETVEKGIGSSVVVEEMDDSGNLNQERAIVLFRPVDSYFPFQYSSAPSFSSSYSVSLDPHTISGFKNQLLWPSQSSSRVKSLEGQEEEQEEVIRDRMAVIPWIPSQLPVAQGMEISQNEASELMEAEGIGEAGMDIEDNNYSNSSGTVAQGQAYGGLPQWQQQQHCLIPQLPQTSPTPITWFR